MKKYVTALVSIVTIIVLLSACSGVDKKEVEKKTANAAAGDSKGYEEHLQKVFKEADELLSTFSSTLDGLYTGETSYSQFATILRNSVIGESSNLVDEVEEYNVDPAFFEINQSLATHVNAQHQLFLDAINMANEEEIDKDTLRTDFLKIKEQQAEIINKWKQM